MKRNHLDKPRFNMFDAHAYGVELRLARMRKGYKRGEDFCSDVALWTGVVLNRETLYRIEKGIQPPTVEQVFAFGLMLYHGRGMEDVLRKTKLVRCATPYAEYLAESTELNAETLAYNGYVVTEDPLTHELIYRAPDMETDVSMIADYYVRELDEEWEETLSADEEEERLEEQNLLADLDVSRWPMTIEDLETKDDAITGEDDAGRDQTSSSSPDVDQ